MAPEIKVDPAALEELSNKVRAEINHVGQVAHQAAAQADVTTGAGALDTALHGFTRGWLGRMSQGEHVGELVAQAISLAGKAYRRTEASVMPTGDSAAVSGSA